MTFSRKLWLSCAVLYAALLLVPATRKVVWRPDLRSHPFLFEEDSLAPTYFSLRRERPTEPADQTAWRVHEPWAWLAAAERWPWPADCAERAVAMAPNSEDALLQQARRWLMDLPREDDLAHATPPERGALSRSWLAVAALTERHPENGLGWYLRAAVAGYRSDQAEAMGSLARGNEAPQVHWSHRDFFDRGARWAMLGGQAELEARLDAMFWYGWPEVRCLRGFARLTVAEGARLRATGEARQAEELALATAQMGARLRDQADAWDIARVGISVQQIAFGGGRDVPKELKDLPEPDRTRRIAQFRAERMIERLRAAGLTERIAWVREQTRRNLALDRARRAGRPDQYGLPAALERRLQIIEGLTWAAWAVQTVALVALMGCLGGFCRRGEEPVAWEFRHLWPVWLVTLPPALLFAGLAASLFGRLWLSDRPLVALPLAWVCSVMVLPLLHELLTRAHLRRSGVTDRAARRELRRTFERRTIGGLASATAALIVLLALSLAVPVAVLRRQATHLAAAQPAQEAAAVQQALRAAR